MNTIEIGGIIQKTPSNWNELTRKQLLMVADLFQKKISLVQFKVKLILSFLGIKRRIIRRIDPEDAYFLTETINFLFEPVTLTKNLIKSIRTGIFNHYFGPDDQMMNCTFGEFTKAHTRLEQYQRTKDDLILDEIAAIFYRPGKILWFIRRYFTDKTDRRRPFIDRTLKKRIHKMRKVDKSIKYSIYLFFTGVMGSLPEMFPNLFRRKDTKADDGGWSDLIISLADDHTDDESLDRVMNSNLYNVLIGLEKKSKEYFKFRQEHPELSKDN
jgi:hypothetical protein